MSKKPNPSFDGPEKPWEAIAEDIGAQFVVPPRRWFDTSSPHLKFPFRQGQVEVHRKVESNEEFTVFRMRAALKREVMVAAFRNMSGQKLLSFASKLSKVDSAPIPGLDDSIDFTCIGGDYNDLIFGDETTQQYLNVFQSFTLTITKSEDSGEISLQFPGLKTDRETVELGIRCVCHLAAILEDNGIISIEDDIANNREPGEIAVFGEESTSRWFRRLPALTAMIIANLVPVVGVVFLGWDAYEIVFLYWLETAVIVLFYGLRLVYPGNTIQEGYADTFKRIFFLIWTGGFSLIHGVFVMVLIGPMIRHPEYVEVHGDGRGFKYDPPPGLIIDVFTSLFTAGLIVSGLTMAAGYAYRFFSEWRTAHVARSGQSSAPPPIGRIISLHIAILIGAALMALNGFTHGIIFMLIGIKLLFDLLTFTLQTGWDQSSSLPRPGEL